MRKTYYGYGNRYATMEQCANGTWDVYNDVQGICIAENLLYPEAKSKLNELYQYYASIEFRRG